MSRFRLSDSPIDVAGERGVFDDGAAGACVSFEGWVRNHNAGRAVLRLDYQAYAALAACEGEAILAEATVRFDVLEVRCIHRVGTLAIGDMAIWVAASAGHRAAAFDACRWIVDEVKRRVPIWKNEHYAEGESGWLHPDNSPVART